MRPEDSIFIDLRTDFGFKRLFGSPERSSILIRFINALFAGRMVVTEVTFHDKEMLPQDPSGKRTIYDVYCTTETGHHFILEMQMNDSVNFPQRVLFYTAKAIVGQGQRGMNYALKPVYTVVFTNFNLKHLSKRLVNEVLLKERTTNEIYSEALRLIFISLPEVKPEWNECDNELEQILYLVKNMHTMDKNSEPYRSGKYSDMFDASECENMACEEVVEYSKSYYKMIDDMAAMEYSKQEARAEGLKEGRAEGLREGRTEGRAEGFIEAAQKLLKSGMSREFICETLGMTPKELGLC